MAWSAHSDPDQVTEYEVPSEQLEKETKQLAQWIQSSRHLVVFTGAGVSTSAGIPDFRGPKGVWTLRAQGKTAKGGTSTSKAMPTLTHMGLVALESAGYLKFVISQNVDGLHRKSGLTAAKLAELHGNTNLEYCPKCGKEYLRDYRCARAGNHVHNHKTGRFCVCGTELLDSIINFKESLPAKALNDGFDHSKRADVFLVLGSSLTVAPANEMPRAAAENGAKLVICNLQRTPLDEKASLRIFAKSDDVMKSLAKHMALEVPEWTLRRCVKLSVAEGQATKWKLLVQGVEPDGKHASLFAAVKVADATRGWVRVLEKEPFVFDLVNLDEHLEVYLEFMGHYNEPVLQIQCKDYFTKFLAGEEVVLSLKFNPKTAEWSIYLGHNEHA